MRCHLRTTWRAKFVDPAGTARNASQHVFDTHDMEGATEIVERLRAVPPQYATADTVGEYLRALQFLADEPGSALWFECMVGLGAHLLECPDGDHGTNIEAAQSVYRRVLACAPRRTHPNEWLNATSGLANALVTHPAADAAAFDEALGYYNEAIAFLRGAGHDEVLAVLLGSAARALSQRPDGDRDANLERAIDLQEEAVRLLDRSAEPVLAIRGRARHNLAKFYTDKRTGVPSQNVDRAVRMLEAALADRPADIDPIGRARTLRALALTYPTWGGADSLAHADQLAQAAADEAEQIERDDLRAARRLRGWAYWERQQSALNVDLDFLYDLGRDDRLPALNAMIENHTAALKAFDPNTMPLRWAEWTAGLARLLGRMPSLGVWDRMDDCYSAFERALGAFEFEGHPRLARQILERWAEVCHEVGDFGGALKTYRLATDLSDQLLDAITDPVHRAAEIHETRTNALFACYAAARLGLADQAVVLGERQRMRMHADVIRARGTLVAVSSEHRNAILDAIAGVQQAERSLRDAHGRDPEIEHERIHARLADYLGVHPTMFKSHRTDIAVDEVSPVAAEVAILRQQLADAREVVRRLVDDDADHAAGGSTDIGGISRSAAEAGCAFVYLVATVHGGATAAVLPDGSCEVLLLDELTSDTSRELLYGSAAHIGFEDAVLSARPEKLDECLPTVIEALRSAAMEQLTRWLGTLGVHRAALVPLGSLGLLPLHAAADDDTVAYSYAPSALSVSPYPRPLATATVAAFTDPARNDTRPLPFSVVEGRYLGSLAAPVGQQVLVGAEVTRDRVRTVAPTGAYVHFGCHGAFRPSDPLESDLRLAGAESLTLADVFAGAIDLSAARLVALLACNSGNVESRRVSDESLGFPAALILGGVSAVISTLWEVDDMATALFACKFYDLVLRESCSTAAAAMKAASWLREASRHELLDRVTSLQACLDPADEFPRVVLAERARYLRYDADDLPYHEPRYWAGFIVTGSP